MASGSVVRYLPNLGRALGSIHSTGKENQSSECLNHWPLSRGNIALLDAMVPFNGKCKDNIYLASIDLKCVSRQRIHITES